METVATILKILLAIISIVLIVLVMMQEGNENGLSASIAGGAGDSSFAARNSGRTKEGKLKKWTRIVLAAFMIISLIIYILQ